MIKLVCFDLDGVLVDSKIMHYDLLNAALSTIDPKYTISYEEHLKKYDGLPTKIKLEILTKEKNLPTELYKTIWEKKQNLTIDYIRKYINTNETIINLFKELKKDGFKIAICSNSIRNTTYLYVEKLGLKDLTNLILTNEDVTFPKPNSAIYLKAMAILGFGPKETLIIEDSFVGVSSAFSSCAHIHIVKDTTEVNTESIYIAINSKNTKMKWKENMNILIPMAGAGSRFAAAGFTFPKPLIEVHNKPMIQVVTENINIEAKYIYIVQKEHYEKYNLKYMLKTITPECEIICTDGLTEGAACTTLLAKNLIDNDLPLLIANSDQFIEWNSYEFIYNIKNEKCDGNILTFKGTHPKWSYVTLDENNNVNQLAEKKVISDIATVGIYYWQKGSQYIKYAESMISKNIRVNNEFYVAPVYNEAIQDGKIIKTFNINKMWGLGTPEDLEYFIKNYKGTI